MEADHFGLQFLHHGAIGRIERRAVGGRDRRGGIEPELPVVGRKPLLPGRLALRIGRGEVRVEATTIDVRLRKAGRDAQAAMGLRNRWQIREGLRADGSFEHVEVLAGGSQRSTAVTGAVAWSGDPMW